MGHPQRAGGAAARGRGQEARVDRAARVPRAPDPRARAAGYSPEAGRRGSGDRSEPQSVAREG